MFVRSRWKALNVFVFVSICVFPPQVSSLDARDAFVLDGDRTIFVWAGAKCNRVAQHKARAIAEIVKNHDRGGLARIAVLNASSDDDCAATPADVGAFWSALGASEPPATIESDLADGADEDAWTRQNWLSRDRLVRLEIFVVVKV